MKLHRPPVYWKWFEDISVTECISFLKDSLLSLRTLPLSFRTISVFHASPKKNIIIFSPSNLISVKSERIGCGNWALSELAIYQPFRDKRRVCRAAVYRRFSSNEEIELVAILLKRNEIHTFQ